MPHKASRRTRRNRRTRRMRGGSHPMPAPTSMSPSPVGGSRRNRRRHRRGGNLGLGAIIKDALVPAALFYGATRVSKKSRK